MYDQRHFPVVSHTWPLGDQSTLFFFFCDLPSRLPLLPMLLYLISGLFFALYFPFHPSPPPSAVLCLPPPLKIFFLPLFVFLLTKFCPHSFSHRCTRLNPLRQGAFSLRPPPRALFLPQRRTCAIRCRSCKPPYRAPAPGVQCFSTHFQQPQEAP